jgi:hypothetical protein
MCAELADLAMQLARAAAARALADWAAPEEPPAEAPQPAEPPAPPAAAQPADLPAPRATAATNPGRAAPSRPASAKPGDPALLFTRLAATVRDCIALEARLAAAPPAIATRTLRADPRRTFIRDVVRLSTTNNPDRAEINRDAAKRLDEHIAADPDQTVPMIKLLEAICEEFGIEIDWATLPDAYLDPICEAVGETGDAPDPCATDPPWP